MLEFNLTLPVMMILFLVFAGLLNALFFQPVSKVLEDRQQYIVQQQEAASAAIAEAKAIQSDYDAKLKAAHLQAQDVIMAAIQEAESKRHQLLDSVKAEVEGDLASARASIQAEREQAVASLQGEVGQFADLIQRKVMGGSPAYSAAGGSDA